MLSGGSCQVPFAGLCHITHICHRSGQTPHPWVKNANCGCRRGLLRHWLLNHRGGGWGVELLARLAWNQRAEWCWRGWSTAGESQRWRTELSQAALLFLPLHCVCRCCYLLVWGGGAFLCTNVNKRAWKWPRKISGHLVCVTEKRGQVKRIAIKLSLCLRDPTQTGLCGVSKRQRSSVLYSSTDTISLSVWHSDNRKQFVRGRSFETFLQWRFIVCLQLPTCVFFMPHFMFYKWLWFCPTKPKLSGLFSEFTSSL